MNLIWDSIENWFLTWVLCLSHFALFYCARSARFNLTVLDFSSVFLVGKLCFSKIFLVCSSLVALVDFTPRELWPRWASGVQVSVASNEFRFGASSSVFMLGAPGFVFTVENFHPLSASLPDAQCHSFSSSRSAGACHQSAFPLLHSRFGQRCLVPSFQQFVHPVTRDKTWFFLGVIVLLDLLCVFCWRAAWLSPLLCLTFSSSRSVP
jgi:hypothetical protein